MESPGSVVEGLGYRCLHEGKGGRLHEGARIDRLDVDEVGDLANRERGQC